jgi:hypothetical protein
MEQSDLLITASLCKCLLVWNYCSLLLPMKASCAPVRLVLGVP